MHIFLKRFQRLSKRLSTNTLFTWIVGFALGGLTNIYPKECLVLFIILTCVYVLKIVWEEHQISLPTHPNNFEKILRAPDENTVDYAKTFEESHFLVEKIIEIIPHPYLHTKAKLTDMGWQPRTIAVKETQKKFQTKKFLQTIGGIKKFDLPNRVKYSLVNALGANTDSPTLSLELQHTDYFTIQSAMAALKVSPSLLSSFSSIVPKENKIPHSLSLHYIVRFTDGAVLVTKRDEGIRYYPGAWSFSGEEQLSEFDVKAQYPIDSLFQRAFCEEILPLSDTDSLRENFEKAKESIESMSVMSVFFEQEIYNFSLFGVYQLNIDAEDFVELYNKFVNGSSGNRDREGSLFLVPQKELFDLLSQGKCMAEGLFNHRSVTIHQDDLHPSSRYRIFRLLRAVNKRPFQESDFQ